MVFTISQGLLNISISKMGLKVIELKLCPHLTGVHISMVIDNGTGLCFRAVHSSTGWVSTAQ